MLIYLYNLLSMPIYALVLKKKIFVSLAALQMFLILALRADDLGVDLTVYSGAYNFISNLNFFDLLERVRFFQTAILPYPYDMESGWVVFNWLIAQTGLGFQAVIVCCAIINSISVGMFIYKYSRIPWLSFFIFFSLGSFTYMFGILRQCLALSILLMGYTYAGDGKWKKVIFSILFAFSIHRTAFIAAPILILFKYPKFNKNKYIASLAMTVPFLFFSSYFYQYIVWYVMGFFNKIYIGRGFEWNNSIGLLIIIMVFLLLVTNFKNKYSNIEVVTFWAFSLSVYIKIIGMYNAALSRSSDYYMMFLCLLIPLALSDYPKKDVRYFFAFLIGCMLFGFYIYTLSGNVIVPYRSILD